jgi:tRNA (cytidine/uridine-2'-O-)-methyltransferase
MACCAVHCSPPAFCAAADVGLGAPAFFGAADDVVLVFGRETGGLPAELHERYAERLVAMPMSSPLVRSLNLSTSVGIATYEVLRQRRSRGA